MANQTVTSDTDLESVISAGLNNGENITINSGAVVTMTETNSVLIGRITINEGKFFIDGENISAGNSITLMGEGGNSAIDESITVNGQGTLEIQGDWFDIGTTDGTDSQVIDLSSATGCNLFNGDEFISWLSMIQIETGRRITYQDGSGVLPEVGDWVRSYDDHSIMGKIKEVVTGSDSETGSFIVWYLTGTLDDDDAFEVVKVVDNVGPDMQLAWEGTVNNASGDIKEAGVYQEFGNCRAAGTSYISAFHHGVGGFVFDHAWRSTDLTLGSSAGTTGGFVPPSGCNIRVPNVMIGSAVSADFDLNQCTDVGGNGETDYYQLECSAGGTIDMSICNLGNALFNDTQAYSFNAEYVGAAWGFGSNICATKAIYKHIVTILDPLNDGSPGVRYSPAVMDLVNGAEVGFCMTIQSKNQRIAIGGETTIGLDVYDCIVSQAGQGTPLSTNTTDLFRITKCFDVTFDNCVAITSDTLTAGTGLYVGYSTNVKVTDFMYSATQDETQQTEERTMISISSQSDGSLIGLKQMGEGCPGNYVIQCSDLTYWKFRCFGMIDDKVPFLADSEHAVYISGLCDNLNFARMWKGGTTSTVEEFILVPTTAKNITVQNCSGEYASEIQPSGGDNIRFKGLHGGSGTPGGATGWEDTYVGSYGNSVYDGFRSDTVGTIACLMITPGAVGNDVTITAGNPLFFKDGDLNMLSGDVIEFEQSYFAKGHTGFSGTYSATSGTSGWNANEWGNVDLEFQWMLEGGSWNGSWLDVRTPSNWTGITGDIEEGVKLKFRFTATGTQNDMSMLLIDTTTTLADQQTNLYPIDQDEVTLQLKAVTASGTPIVGARIRVTKDVGGAVVLSGTTNALGIVEDTAYIYTADEAVSGYARKSTSTPFYKQGNVSGTISSTGLTMTAVLVSDD